MARKTQSPIWELGLAVREKDEATGKNIAVCKVKIDADNPDLTCNKQIGLPGGSTSLLRKIHEGSFQPVRCYPEKGLMIISFIFQGLDLLQN